MKTQAAKSTAKNDPAARMMQEIYQLNERPASLA
jgi:hypothetical protein